MILTVKEVQKLLIKVHEQSTGLDSGRVIFEGEGPRPPDGCYCSLWWKEIEPLPENSGSYSGQDKPSDYDKTEPLTLNLRNEAWCTVQVSFWGPDAMDTAVRSMQALNSDARWFDLWRVLGYGGVSRIQNISAQFRGKIQPRLFYDLTFYACFGTQFPADWFDSSQWQLGLRAGDVNNPETQEFEYSKEIRDDQDPCCLS